MASCEAFLDARFVGKWNGRGKWHGVSVIKSKRRGACPVAQGRLCSVDGAGQAKAFAWRSLSAVRSGDAGDRRKATTSKSPG